MFVARHNAVGAAFSQEKEQDRVKEAGEVLKEILDAPDKGIRRTCWIRRSALLSIRRS